MGANKEEYDHLLLDRADGAVQARAAAPVGPYFRGYAIHSLLTFLTVVVAWNICEILPGEGAGHRWGAVRWARGG